MGRDGGLRCRPAETLERLGLGVGESVGRLEVGVRHRFGDERTVLVDEELDEEVRLWGAELQDEDPPARVRHQSTHHVAETRLERSERAGSR